MKIKNEIDYDDIRNNISKYYELEKKLKIKGVWNSNRPFHTDLGEWLTENIFGYFRSKSRTNSDGDFKDNN